MSSKLPTGRFRRAVDVARVGARTGASWLLSRGTEKAADRAAEVLGNLRGLAAKIGQTASYVDGIVPPEHRAAYSKALSQLQSATVSSSPKRIAEVIERELGAPPTELFARWEAEPVASASIGQVHRAELFDGRTVAVKVQHPDIDQAVEGDLKNVALLEGLVTLAGPRGFRAGPIFEEVLRRFREELDYRLEAQNQESFRFLHARDPMIRIPAVIAERSSRRVLTSEWVEGATLHEAARAPEELRRSHAEVLWRFVFRGNLVAGRFNADPHPGNYLFHGDGSVTFLDFGCVQPLAEHLRKTAISVHRAAIAGDEEAFGRGVAELLGTRGGRYGEASQRYTRKCFEPLFSAPFRMTHEYASDLFRATKELKAEMYAGDGSFVAPPPHLAFMNRLQFGFYSVLAALDVAVDYREVERAFLDEAEAQTNAALGPSDDAPASSGERQRQNPQAHEGVAPRAQPEE